MSDDELYDVVHGRMLDGEVVQLRSCRICGERIVLKMSRGWPCLISCISCRLPNHGNRFCKTWREVRGIVARWHHVLTDNLKREGVVKSVDGGR